MEFVEIEGAREEFALEAMASWDAYRKTGRHLAGAELIAWLSDWGTDSETELPVCHD